MIVEACGYDLGQLGLAMLVFTFFRGLLLDGLSVI